MKSFPASGKPIYCLGQLLGILLACMSAFNASCWGSFADYKVEYTSSSWSKAESSDTLSFPPCNHFQIPDYTAHRIKSKIHVDGKLDEGVWQRAKCSANFRDLISGDTTRYDTRAAVMWDDEFLYVGYWIEEPYLQASLTKRDAPIYQDNDVELFIAGEDAYYEFEINAYGTIYEVFFIWEESYLNKGYSNVETFDLDEEGVRYFNGVGLKNHPRGLRIGYWNWDYPGLQSGVHLKGSINDDTDIDEGWTVELALPWAGLRSVKADGKLNLPPKDGDAWRMDFSRFNQKKAPPPVKDSGGWAWSPHGVWDSHVPECFTYIYFSDQAITEE